MSWKQTAQYSLADAPLIEHKSLYKLDDAGNCPLETDGNHAQYHFILE